MSVVIQAALLLWVARQSSPADFGGLMAGLSAAYVVVALGDGGLQPFAIRERASDRTERPQAGTTAFTHASRLTAVVAAGIVAVLPLAVPGLSVWHAAGVAAMVWLERQFLGRLSLAIAVGRSVPTSALLVVARVTAAVVMVAGHLLGWSDEIANYLLGSIAGLGTSLVVAMLAFPQQKEAELPSWGQLMKSARPFWWSNLWTQLRGLDAFLVGLVASPTTVAHYALPNRLGQAVRVVPSVLSSLGQPAAVREDAPRLRRLDLATAATCFCGVLAWLLLLFFGNDPFLTLVGAAYEGAFMPLLWVAAAQVVNVPGIYLSGVLIGRGLERQVAQLDAVVTVLLIVGVLLAASTHGATGAAAGLFVAMTCQSVGAAVLRHHKGWYSWSTI
ncbi:hypothetical protein EXE58_10550 [Nocardioides seonyuensis]|uniref:Polysaccharide biosynthesis protein C-terminal domain-containing protein n=1 Tax=Nocardioides seonyuensis TaxID=2518371 RepID=A0A4P7IF18_9ACTN|nr:hypothetical protein [Nocardioides seonyuensis]QBX55855.1 hypothetical protein EXE58_10550 [Nocardioides seonyuensis]